VIGLYENFNSVSTFIENPFRKNPFSYVPEGSTENEIRRDLLFSYFSFYLNYARLKSIFTRPDKGVGWFSAGGSALSFLKKIPGLAVLVFMLLVKFIQLFYFTTIRKETRISADIFPGYSPE